MTVSYPKALYEADDNLTYNMRMSAADQAAQKTPPSVGSATGKGSVKISKGKRQFGIRPRRLRLYRELTAGTGAAAVTKILYDELVIPVKADFATYNTGNTVTIAGTTWTVLKLVPEEAT